MKSFRNVVVLCACMAPAVSGSAAEPAMSDASSAAPAIQYRSAFDNYRAYRETPVADWRSLNEDVGRAGGHLGIMRGHASPPKPQPATGSASGAPAGGAHAH